MKVFGAFCLLLIACFVQADSFSRDGVWQSAANDGSLKNTPSVARVFLFHREMALLALRDAPLERTPEALRRNIQFTLPMPDGSFQLFRIEESPVMEAGLAAKFPEIHTYRAQGIDDPSATARFGITSGGFHAFGFSAAGAFVLEPHSENGKNSVASFWVKDAPGPLEPIHCLTGDPQHLNLRAGAAPFVSSTGSVLHTYRIAIGADAEYTAFFGGVANALNNGIVVAMTSLNAILEQEIAVHVNVIANETNIIYTNAATDPYTDGNSGTMADENQVNINAEIGPANYDIGHAFGGSGGSGLAYLGVTCFDSFKARAASTFGNPNGTTWIVDLVAHEVGHQLSADHSFNGTTGSCGGGNRSPSTAWEPGSGSTIMSYSGSCGAENLQGSSDPFYHVGNYDEMTQQVGGDNCDIEAATGNNPPTVNAGADHTIPKSTPFTLTATGSDPDGDSLTYIWEQNDAGAAAPPNTDDGTRAIFRSFTPQSSPSRTFPKLSDILNNTTTLGESLPTTNRTLTFRVTARDNHSGTGGVSNDTTLITVDAGSGPFQVTTPNTAVTWTGGTTEAVHWNVSGTSGAPVNTATVNILLSTDGGTTFPIVLLNATPNDGTENITVPNLATNNARVKVEAVGNVFFDVSNVNFTVVTGGCAPIIISPSGLPTGVIGTAYNATLTPSGGVPPFTIVITDGALPPGLTMNSAGNITGTPTTNGSFSFTVTATDDNACTGVQSYTIDIFTDSCLFCDDFNNGVLDPLWTYTNIVSWSETGGNLVVAKSKKNMALATAVFSGCANCTVEADISNAGGGRVWLLGWYQDKKNFVELMMNEKGNKWILKQHANGKVAKATAKVTIDPNVAYHARITFDGTDFRLYINDVPLITLAKKAASTPAGTVGFQAKKALASFNSISVN